MSNKADSGARWVFLSAGAFLCALAIQGLADGAWGLLPEQKNRWAVLGYKAAYMVIVLGLVLVMAVFWEFKGEFTTTGCTKC